MPWKGEKDSYKIWVSEIILQQTRVQQGMDYYNRFIDAFPDITSLATAPEMEVYKLWEGLGYYSRCKNLIATAKSIHEQRFGIFPDQYEEILSLKGIGPYTASAIASFAFKLPHAVVDGNVFRVLSRFFGCHIEINTRKGKQFYSQLADKLLDKDNPDHYNQAIMDFGATVCKPANPACKTCPMQRFCIAYQTGSVNKLPVKEKLLKKKVRHLNWILLEADGLFYIHERTAADIWQHLHEFYLIETPTQPDWDNQSLEELLELQLGVRPTQVKSLGKLTQQLTHQKILGNFYYAKFREKPKTLRSQTWLSRTDLHRLAFPKMLNNLGFF